MDFQKQQQLVNLEQKEQEFQQPKRKRKAHKNDSDDEYEIGDSTTWLAPNRSKRNKMDTSSSLPEPQKKKQKLNIPKLTMNLRKKAEPIPRYIFEYGS